MTLADRRDAVAFLRTKGVSERRACRLFSLGRSSLRYRPREGRDEALRQRLLGLARRHPRYGYRRAWAVLRREGWTVNLKRVHRVWKELGLAVPRRRRRRRRGGSHDPVPVRAEHPSHVWTYDFLKDHCENGQALRVLTLVDEFTRECLAIEVGGSFDAPRVIAVLDRAFAEHGPPEWLRSDNGPEFIAEVLKAWLAGRGAKPRHIDPGCPWQNAYGESFNGKLRDECLNLELFANRREAAVILEAWRHSYNTQRPHSSLGYQTPREFRSGLTRGEGSGPDGPLSRIDPGGDLAILVPAASVGATLIPLASLLAGGRPASMIVAVSLILLVALAVRLLTIKIPRAIPRRAGGQHGAARDAADRAG